MKNINVISHNQLATDRLVRQGECVVHAALVSDAVTPIGPDSILIDPTS
jgi:hypothetical protein